LIDHLNGKYYTVSTTDDTSSVIWDSKETDYTISDMKLADYNDPRWNDLLDQLSMEEAMGVVACGGNQFRAMESVGFVKGNYSENSGNGVALSIKNSTVTADWAVPTDDNNAEYPLEVFACGPMVASSFDPDLQYELGEVVGLQAAIVGLPILWGPGLNTHRTAYNGRNGDYYTEDAVLCGTTGMEFSIGALKYGLIAAPKHFAFNDQETNRNGLAPFMTEQRARETELRAFQIAVEATKYDTPEHDASMLGLMTSFSKIGGVECTASRGLLTDICRNEWGFRGYAVSDIRDDFDIFSCVVNAGLTGYDVRIGYSDSGFDNYQSVADGVKPSADLYKNDLNLQKQLKVAAKNVLFAFSQSNMMNAVNKSSHAEWNMTWWRGVYMAIDIVAGVALAACLTLYILAARTQEGE
jgi:beta-glucosidase